MRGSTGVLLFLALVPTLSGPGCQSPRITDRRLAANPTLRAGLGGLVPRSNHSISTDEIAFARLRDEIEAAGAASPERMLELADLADRIGRRRMRPDQMAALPWFRDAATYAILGLTAAGPSDSGSLREAQAVALHNHAVEELLRCAGTGPRDTNPVWREQLAAVGVEITPSTVERAAVPYRELWIASDFRVRNLERVGRDGLGVPLITMSLFPNRDAAPDRFLPERLRLPATAVLHVQGPPQGGALRSRPVTLVLHDSARETTVALQPGSPPLILASDLTTPLAHQFIRSPVTQLAWGGLFRPEAYDSTPGILMNGPYQPGKIPVLFIHGLWSAPDAWLKMVNGLQADPSIRGAYQFWFAYYPSGAPLMTSAARLRQSLHELRAAIDPRRSDPALDRMVVVGHSLGGLLTKQLIQSSGGSLEQSLFTRPLAAVAMSPESRAALTRFLHFEPEPSIRRVVFIATPHRGSNTANQTIGRLGSTLVQRPGALSALFDEILSLNGPDVFQPAYRRGPPTSIENLKSDSPILNALSQLPLAPGVPHHTIVANLFPNAPPRFWTDGLVSYESAHLDGEESEIMVRHNHFVNGTTEATLEVHRILRLHLGLPSQK